MTQQANQSNPGKTPAPDTLGARTDAIPDQVLDQVAGGNDPKVAVENAKQAEAVKTFNEALKTASAL